MKKSNEGINYQSQKIEMRSIPRCLFEDYFHKKAIKQVGDIYWGKDWIVELSKEDHTILGSITMVVVEIKFCVKKENFDAFLFDFRKNFIRGGG
jgi:hypothetical protein